MNKFKITNKNHPAYGKYFRIRRVSDEMVLVEWCTWSSICTWIFPEVSNSLNKFLKDRCRLLRIED